MNDKLSEFMDTTVESWDQGVELLERLFTVAEPGAVFSEPLETDGQTIITASEVFVGVGFGYGAGGGTGPEQAQGEGEEAAEEGSAGSEESGGEEDRAEVAGYGSGGGGGGGSSGRPVAVISVGAGGVKVQPIVDVTKIGIAALTTFGSMLIMLGKMRRAVSR